MNDTVTILLVEDNPGDVGLIEEAFREGKLRHNLHIAEDGEEAMDYLYRRGKFTGVAPPDLVLLDLNLPRKDGREVLNEMKSDPVLADIPVIVLTTSDAEADVLGCYKLHANCYLTKPVNIDDFLRKIRGIEDFWLTLVRLPRRK